MNKDELKQLRRNLGMTQTEFGEWLAKEVNASQDQSLKQIAPYTRQRVHAWENGDVVIPAKIEIVAVRRELKQKDAELQRLKQKQKP